MKAKIDSIASYLPEQRLTNAELSHHFPDWAVDKIFAKTGIETRAIADESQTSLDLGYAAAEMALSKSSIPRNEIDFLLFCSQSPDYFLPSSSCILQERLGLSVDCGALDFNLGCSGFVYGCHLAKSMIESNQAKNVLLITSETYSKFLSPEDRSVRTIFGDGAAATIFTKSENDQGIGPIQLGTDGRGAVNLMVKNGAARNNFNGDIRSLCMNGPEILEFTMKAVPLNVNKLLSKAEISIEKIDYFVFHQANAFILSQLRRKLSIPPEKFCINMQDYANTVSATIPMAIEKALSFGQIKSGHKILICGFGVGYSWGSALIDW